METAKLKKFAQFARRSLLEQVSAKLKLVLAENSSARRERVEAVKKLEEAIKGHGKEQVIERVAYTWFNRFCALRFMDVNRYIRIGVVSPAEGQFQPEILAEAKMGHIDEEMVSEKTRQQIFALLDGKAPSRDPQGEAYRLQVVAACNFFHRAMPFLFQRINDYTELLMPDDLLSGNAILAYTREAMTPDACEDVEVIGWLYQFYISEKKDEVFDGLKKNKKITPENIPAATQLFTPHWIVKYLVENSLGRLWMLNRPNSRLVNRMEYYIRPETSGVRNQGLGDSDKTGGKNGSEELSGPDRLAEGDGCGRAGLQSNKEFPEGGALRADQSGSQGGGVNSVQHSGGARSQLDCGIQELPFDSSRLQSGSGNANSDRPTSALHISAASARNTLSAQRDQQNVSGAEKQTNPWPLTPTPSASTHEEDFLRIEKPEDIKICDPACGSGHMLTYAFDLLYAIYEEEGYDPAEIPEKILTNNLYGIEIDERAGELAAFALTMKARAKQRRFFNKSVKPNICVLQNIHFDEDELKEYMDFIGYDLFTAPLQATLRQFEEADNFGSLIRPDVTDVDRMRSYLKLKNVSGHLFLSKTHEKVLQALQQADYLSPKYHVVIANPPYMGSVGMNPKLKSFAAKHYKLSKGDLFSMFIERSFHLSSKQGFISMITLQNWMFLSSYEAIRLNILEAAPIRSLVQVGFNSFPELNSKFALGAAFILQSQGKAIVGDFVNLNDAPHAANKQEVFLERKRSGKIYRVNPRKFSNIPGSPIQYSLSDGVFRAFSSNPKLGDLVDARNGMTTGDNENFVRRWNEVSFGKTSIASHSGANVSTRWFPYNKGGQTRKWYGNQETVVDWRSDGLAIKAIRPKSTTRNTDFFFRESVSWSDINIKNPSFRYYDDSFCFDAAVNSAFPSTRSELLKVLSACNNCFVSWMSPILNPTMHFKIGDFSVLPAAFRTDERVEQEMETVLAIARSDWDSYETSWDFASLPLLNPDYRQPTLKATYQKLRAHWQEMTLEMQRLEEENNRIFIEAYGLQDELTPEVPLNEITLTCNPWYRYSRKLTKEHTENTENNHSKNSVRSVYSVVNKSFPIDDELEALLLADTMRELVSYAVGCMFGRYALDKPGLILANQGETIEDYYKKVSTENTENTENNHSKNSVYSVFSVDQKSFPADDDNVIPMLDGDWFTDDIAERFRQFLRVAFGDEHYEANLKFVEKALGKNGKTRDIRDYFLKDFYNDHVRRYKKRPIYWLFSSPKGSFNALIYMHRYRPDTVSVVLNDYLREFRTKLTSHKNHLEAVSISGSASQSDKTKALKEIEKITKMIAELEEYEREVLYPLATERVEIDLDDGVKVNYPKFGAALKKIVGLDAKED